MSQHDRIETSGAFERVAHWLLAISCLVLLLTGLGLLFKTWTWIGALFGGPLNMKEAHDASAWVFMASLFLALLSWGRDCLTFDAEDGKWLAKMGGYLSRKPMHFNMYKFNPGQKVFFIFVILGGIGMSLSGLALLYPDSVARELVRWAGALHVLIMFGMSLFIIVHVYLGTIGNPGSVSAILSGRSTRAWARTHRPRWFAKYPNGLGK